MVSICIPTYNQTSYLKKVLDSVFEQTYTDYEVIISDDSRSEEVKFLVEKYKHHHQSIHYFHHSPSLGSPENWNFAIKQAQGEYIKIMHHDDSFSKPNSLEKFVKLMYDENADMVFCGSDIVKNEKRLYIHAIDQVQFQNIQKKPESLFFANLIGGPSATMFRTRIQPQFDATLKWLVDVEMYYRLFKENVKISFLREPLVITHVTQFQITNDCAMNANVEIPEILYCVQKHRLKSYYVLKMITKKLQDMKLQSLSEIKSKSKDYPLQSFLSMVFIVKTSPLYLLYSKFLRRLRKK